VGAAVYLPAKNQKYCIRLPDNLSIYYAEGYAILTSLICATNFNLSKFCIFSDNSKILQDIKYSDLQTSPHPSLIQSITEHLKTYKNSKILIKWLPGHCNHPDTNTIDTLAKEAISADNYHNINFSKYEANHTVDVYIWNKWLEQWKSEPNGNYQNTFPPTKYSSASIKSRKKDVIRNRMRMLQTKLNSGLHKLGLHENGNCDICGVQESSKHFILECKRTEQLRKDMQKYQNISNKPDTYQRLMANDKTINLIINFIINENIEI